MKLDKAESGLYRYRRNIKRFVKQCNKQEAPDNKSRDTNIIWMYELNTFITHVSKK